MSLILSAELAAACNALGHYDPKSKVYFNEDNLVETVKDIIRYLRRDTDSHEIRRYFGAAKILQINLVPLLKLYWEQTDLFDVLLRLMGNLTSPVLLLFNEAVPKEKTVRNYFLQILGHLQSYKEAFADESFWAALVTRLSQLLSIETQERGTENGLIIERILILVRNVLSVPADLDDEKRADNDVSAHDKVLWSLRQSGLVDLIHYMVSRDEEESYSLYLLEILSLMLREHRPLDLAQASGERTETEKTQDDNEFTRTRTREMAQRQERRRNYNSVRHSRFGGTFNFQNLKSVNDTQELIFHKKLNTAASLNFDIDKNIAKVAKNRQPVRETTSHRRSTFSIRLLLKDFCIEFLNSGYNKLMHTVRGKLVRGKSMENDETYYLWALRFFMEFNRHYKFNVKLVSETVGREIFHYIQQRMEHYYDMIHSDKTNWPLWSKRLHLAIQAYKELLLNIATMDKSTDSTIREHAKIIKSNIFYVVEYREFVVQLLAAYDEKKMSDAYLLDLIETQHVFLKMLQVYCGNGSSIVVQKIQKIKKTKKRQHTAGAPTVSLEEALESKWDELGPQLSTVLEGGANIPVVVPFDAASEVPINDQRTDAMINIQDYLREGEIENAIGLLRAARDVWPDNDSFGSSSMTSEEEFLAIREIFFAKLRDKEEIPAQQENEQEEEDDEDEEDDDDGAVAVEREVDFKFQDFEKRFAQPKVIQACGLALRQFDTNPVHVNHCILKLLHRIAWDCKMPAMLFQASIFRTFQRIFAETDRPEFKELYKFATFIVRQFIKVGEKNKKIFMELLFWKNARDACDAEEGYGSYETKSNAMKKSWTEEEENELRVLFMEHKEKEIQEDVVDWLMNNLVDNTKTRKGIIKKLKDLMLLENYTGRNKKASASSRPPKDWEEAEIEQLTELYNDFKDAMDPLSCIMDRLDVKRPKARVKQKILELGLADNKALRKKRPTKSRGHQEEEDKFQSFRSNNDDDDDEIIDSDSSSSDEENENRSNITATKAAPRSKDKAKRSTIKKAVKNQKLELPALKKLILELVKGDMTDSLKWISESLIEAAEDQEQEINLDGNEGIPLVPINAKDIQAIKNPVFGKFLLGIGIQKPASEQERFWRIPGNILAAELTEQAKRIDEIIEKGTDAFPEYNEPPIVEQPAEESSDEDVFDRLRNFVSKPNMEEPEPYIREVDNEIENETNENNSIIEYDLENGMISQNSESSSAQKSKNIPAKSSKKAITMEDNEIGNKNNEDNSIIEYDLENGMMSQNSKSSSAKKTKNIPAKSSKKRITMIDDSDESDSNSAQTNYLKDNEDVFNVTKSVEKKKTKRISLLNDSDESGSDITVLQNKNKSKSEKKKTKRISVPNDSDESDSEITIPNESENNFENKNAAFKPNTKKKSKIIQQLDSDESDTENVENNKDIETTKASQSNITKKSKKILDESDESDSGRIGDQKINQSEKKPVEDFEKSDNEDEDTGTLSKRNRDSDSESNDSHSVKRKKLAIIDSDED